MDKIVTKEAVFGDSLQYSILLTSEREGWLYVGFDVCIYTLRDNSNEIRIRIIKLTSQVLYVLFIFETIHSLFGRD